VRVLLQRVSQASVTVDGRVTGEIGQGLLLLVGIRDGDTTEQLDWMARKVVQLRVFNDTHNKMNLSVQDVGGGILAVSQFTLYADAEKGNRPSYIRAARPEVAQPLYERFCDMLAASIGKPVQRGVFGAHMDVALTNDGPVTIMLEREGAVPRA
jgi:D-tyrosyl-tRNA(Tyr) deacylase